MNGPASHRLVAPAITALCGAALTLIVASLVAAQSGDRPRTNQAVTIEGVVPRMRIINFDEGLARFDTATGAIARLSGNLDNASTQITWTDHVGAVEQSSGLLEIQQPRGVGAFADATFLVDIVSGDTWILRRRGVGATWDAVR